MNDPLFNPADDAATPLDADERRQLIPTYITTRAELNEAEQIGVADADRWAFSRRRDPLDIGLLRRLHKRMFGRVWRWAGEYRTTARNIGIDAYRIAPELAQLVDDVRYWNDHATFQPDEIALRFHHRLVSIHPFPNGNGRHARLAADMLIVRLGHPRFTWGSANLVNADETRTRYIAALRAADGHNVMPLLEFSRT